MLLSSQSASTQDEDRQLIHLQKDILRATLSQGNVRDTVEHICRLAEPLLPESVATVLLLNDEGRLDVFAAPNVPAEALPHLSGLQPGPETCSCGNAVMPPQEPIFVADTLSDNRWRQLRPLALDFGIMACWSMPIRDSQDRVIGSFALLSFVHRSPSPFHVQVLETVASVISLVLDYRRLQEHVQLQARALEAISEGVLITGTDERVLFVNPAFIRITGYSLDEMRGRYCTILQNEDSDADTKARIRTALSRGEDFNGEILNVRKDGSPFWNELTISPVRDQNGTITNFVSVQRDVTARKAATQDLRIAATAFEAQEAIFITDAETRILRINKAFSRITGYAAEEVLGQTPTILQSGRQDRAFYQAMWDAIARDGFWHGEIWNQRKNGDVYPELLTISAVHDEESGEDVGYVGYFTDITQRKAREELIQRMAFYDALTDLPNRHFLEIQIEQSIARAVRHKQLMALCILDLDNFKPVNDICGHESGDEVLAALGKRLPEALRRSDFVARLGGDEFVLLVEELSGLDDLTKVLIKVEETITAPILLSNGKTVSVGASMGVALYPFGDDEAGDQLLRQADQALYESKAHKGGRERSWTLFDKKGNTLRTPAQRLLDSGALEVWYQPILDSRVCKVVGVEALARLRGEDGKIWTPAEFLPQLQEMDLFELSRQALQQALIDLSILDAAGFPLWVSVNIDARSISEACVACLHEMIAQFGVDPSRIVLEILEGSDFLEQPMALEHLQTLKTQGLRLALDDVGSAYASLLRMKNLPIDKIKMDQDFVRTLESRPQDLHFIRAIQELAMELKVDLVVEGVETADILDAMMTTGVPYLQGYAISRPVPFAKLQMFLTDYSPLDQDLPTGLFGFYAGTLSFHISIKKMLMANPSEINSEVLSDPRHCRWHGVLLRLGYGDDSPLQRIHNDYHRVLGTTARNATQNIRSIEWKMVDESLEVFLDAILSEWQKTH